MSEDGGVAEGKEYAPPSGLKSEGSPAVNILNVCSCVAVFILVIVGQMFFGVLIGLYGINQNLSSVELTVNLALLFGLVAFVVWWIVIKKRRL
ncbi:MAG: hypothetical protein ACFFEF_16495 [Candidatus Thorarchaeota archaeon]